MFSIEAGDAERLIKISWLGHVDSDEIRRRNRRYGLKDAARVSRLGRYD
jgi:hypothetical protein